MSITRVEKAFLYANALRKRLAHVDPSKITKQDEVEILKNLIYFSRASNLTSIGIIVLSENIP